jgi:2-octaprenyl-6-methoxyphenol hydroxylase
MHPRFAASTCHSARVFGRTLLKASDYGIDALGYVVPYASLTSMLTGRVSALPVEVRQNARIDRCETAGSRIDMSLSDGSVLSADYVIHAEGQQDDTVPKRKRDYGQSALSAIVKASHPVADTAYERFTEEGPLALLPAKDGYALVWCAKTCGDRAANDVVGRRNLGRALQHFRRNGWDDSTGSVPSRQHTARSSRCLKRAGGPREFSIGNAAQSLHPVAGQGFNLGLRDAFNASEAIATHFTDPELAKPRLSEEPGA